jgi:3-deoxy-D-manno-octulosonate 8-phosphate phosphatase (KDO 8-P phosphatase)
MLDVSTKAKRIKLVVFDVDGVLTNGGISIGDDGQEYKTFNTQDGLGLRMLQTCGIQVAIITGRTSKVVEYRMTDLGIQYVYQGRRDKRFALKELLDRLSIIPEDTAYVGDDIIDLPVLTQVGFAICVANAHPLVRPHVHWITKKRGGYGAAREVCDMILNAQGLLDGLVQKYLAQP